MRKPPKHKKHNRPRLSVQDFPLAAHLARNHQGAAKHFDEVTPLIQTKIDEGHFAPRPGGCATEVDGVAMDVPDMLPAIQVPINGTEQKLKEKQFFARDAGEDYKLNVRPTFDGSSPHNGASPHNGEDSNSFCELSPELNLPWISIVHIVWAHMVMLLTNPALVFTALF